MCAFFMRLHYLNVFKQHKCTSKWNQCTDCLVQLVFSSQYNVWNSDELVVYWYYTLYYYFFFCEYCIQHNTHKMPRTYMQMPHWSTQPMYIHHLQHILLSFALHLKWMECIYRNIQWAKTISKNSNLKWSNVNLIFCSNNNDKFIGEAKENAIRKQKILLSNEIFFFHINNILRNSFLHRIDVVLRAVEISTIFTSSVFSATFRLWYFFYLSLFLSRFLIFN